MKEKKFIVFERNLLELFKKCESCHRPTCSVQKVVPKSFGSQLKVVAYCVACHHKREWHSQPKVGDINAGNLCISSAILFGGGSPSKILRIMDFMNLQTISNSTFLKHQKDYLQPAVVRVWERQQAAMISKIKEEDRRIVIGGDGRSDSPGHSAKFGSYTFMDMEKHKVIDLQLVQVSTCKKIKEKKNAWRNKFHLDRLLSN